MLSDFKPDPQHMLRVTQTASVGVVVLSAGCLQSMDQAITIRKHPPPPSHALGARLRGRMATQRSKKGSDKVLGRVLGGSEILRRLLRRGSEKGISRRRLERPLGEYDL